jgi:uncharacterized protein with HEPN domain
MVDRDPPDGRDPALFVADMIEFCDRVMEYTAGFGLEALLADRMRFDATLRNVELIGEAASRVSPAIRALSPEIEWRQIVGVRNRLAHAYLTLDTGTLWLVITDSVPRLRSQLRTLMDTLSAAPE